jgi:hypothetical protein
VRYVRRNSYSHRGRIYYHVSGALAPAAACRLLRRIAGRNAQEFINDTSPRRSRSAKHRAGPRTRNAVPRRSLLSKPSYPLPYRLLSFCFDSRAMIRGDCERG